MAKALVLRILTGEKIMRVLVDPKVNVDLIVNSSTDLVDPNNPANLVVDPTDKHVGPVVRPTVGSVDKPDVRPEYNVDKPSAVGLAIGLNMTVFSIWKAFGGNTRDLGSFGEETDKTTELHQHLSRLCSQQLEKASLVLHDAVTTHLVTVS
uniref:Uncharacterized protein n=1 Tax=Tanacetum cinerariifolium TaxID=118510 RepID=A0A699J8F8_TANCI|nr:hypothetical protein [Tanacetum cinerariifolium]